METAHREYGRNGRLGVIVPPANPVAEPELQRLVPVVHQQYVTRLAPQASPDLLERVDGYLADLARAGASFGNLRLDAVALAFAATSFLIGSDREGEVLAAVRAGRNVPVTTAAAAVVERMRVTGRRVVTLVSPYPDALDELAEKYWTDNGLKVRATLRLEPPGGAIYELASRAVFEIASRYRPDGAEMVVLCGTGLASLDQLRPLRQTLGVPVVSYNSCLAWWATTVLSELRTPEGGQRMDVT